MIRPRGRWIHPIVAAVLVAACASAHAADVVTARRAIRPEAAERMRGRGQRVDAAVMTPADIAAQEARTRGDRRFKHVLTSKRVDWSRLAARRPGWVRPARPARGATAATPDGALALEADTIRIAYLRLDFAADRGGAASTGDGRFELTVDTTRVPFDRPPRNRAYFEGHAEALNRYYDAQSYGRVVVQGDVWPRSSEGAYTVSDMADLGPWSFGQGIYRAAVHMMRTMFFAADSQSTLSGDRIPWDSYDRFIIIHAGSDLQSDVLQDSGEDIPSFTMGVEDTDVVIFPDSTTRAIDRCLFIPETIHQDGYYGVINGVLAHECGHLLFGLADVYDIASGWPVCGFWSLMDTGNQVGLKAGLANGDEIFVSGVIPPSLDPFQRPFVTDALEARSMVWDVADSLLDIARHPDLRRVDLTGDEYLLLENRWLTPATGDTLRYRDIIDADPVTTVVLGPKAPDRYEYDMLLPGGGVLIWHVDGSVFPLESAFPLDTALRVNPDFGLNTDPLRPGLSVIEADGLGDLGDPSSPLWLGSWFDPFFLGNHAVLADSTAPNLIPHIGTRTHMRIDVLDSLRATMRVRATRGWAMAGWPRRVPFALGGADLMAIAAEGRTDSIDVCWAGGTRDGADSAGIFVMRPDGRGPAGQMPPLITTLARRPDPRMAAIVLPAPIAGAAFAVVTRPAFPGDTAAGWLHVVNQFGDAMPGFPRKVGETATPPVVAGDYPNAAVFVGQADGRVHAFALTDGTPFWTSASVGDTVVGRLAVRVDAIGPAIPQPPGQPPVLAATVAAGGQDGDVRVESFSYGIVYVPESPGPPAPWSAHVGDAAGFEPDFLWIPFGGAGADAVAPCATPYSLVVRTGDRLFAYCEGGLPLPGWGRAAADPLVAALGAGDADGDGYPEVLIQTAVSGVGFVNVTGAPSPGWPKRVTDEFLRSVSAPLAADVDGDGQDEVVAMSGTGIIAALRGDGRAPAGWPLASGAGAAGSPVIADLDGDGFLELVASDNVDRIWGYALGVPATGREAAPWPMLGGDPGRTCTLPIDRAPLARAASAGPLVGGSLMAYPNPARRRPVNFAYRLTEPARVEFKVLDTSGHEVASFSRDGRQSDNLETWDPGTLPGGLYLVQVGFHSAGRESHQMLQVGLLR